MKCLGYLDIETTGLSSYSNDLTVIGLHIEGNGDEEVIQLVGEEIRSQELVKLVENVDVIYTYNGSRFDLPFIKTKLRVDIKDYCKHKDLMYACWNRNLRGGLKAVEKQLGIQRKLSDVNGYEAVLLWNKYTSKGCMRSLTKLLKYNAEDVLNLKQLRKKLCHSFAVP